MFLRLYSTTFTFLFLGIFLVNVLLFHQPILGGILLGATLLFYGKLLAHRLSPKHLWLGIFFLLSSLICVGSFAYYLLPFTSEVALGVFLLCLPLWLWFGSHGHPQEKESSLVRQKLPIWFWIASALVVLGCVTGFFLLVTGATTEAIRTPWDQIPSAFFLVVFLALLLLSGLLFLGQGRSITCLLTSGMLFLFLAVALIVYPLGYGFDTFIHQATEQHIATFGSITPKPLYYTGQYVLVLLTHHLFFLPIIWVDKLLVPLLAALLLPLAWYHAALRLLHDKRIATASLIGLFLLPLSSWIVTTPQGLANLFVLLTILTSVPLLIAREGPRPFQLLLPTLATLLIHPLAGIPLLLYLAFLLSRPSEVQKQQERFARILSIIIFVLTCLALPLSFLLNALFTHQTINLTWDRLWHLEGMETLVSFFSFDRVFAPLLDGVYSFGSALPLIFCAIALAAWWINKQSLDGRLRSLGLISMALFLNYIFLSTAVEFTFLIEYERANYADRILPLLLFFLTPFVIVGLGMVIVKAKTWPISLRAGLLILLCGLALSNLYLTYPRDDAFVTGHNINTSQADLEAVALVASDAGGDSYLVLANQSVSAAAIRSLGFGGHYFGSQYRYPIPTGGTLYQFFLEMNESPSQDTALQAASFARGLCVTDLTCTQTPVTHVYFIVNTYWWDATRIIETAKGTADEWMSTGNGKDYIFRYDIEGSKVES